MNSYRRRPRSPISNRQLQTLLTAFLGRKNARIAAALAAAIALGVAVFTGRNEAPRPRSVETARTEQTRQGTSPARSGQEISGRVVKVSDGDTITLLQAGKVQTKIRLGGIDAPEKSQPFGHVCREKLASMIAGQEIAVQVMDTDRYGRTIGRIVVAGKDVNLAQVEAGCAWHYKQYTRNQTPEERALYAAKEVEARKEKRGLWKDPAPQAPWEYRREIRQGERVPSGD